jgi:hypothetical protein
MPIAIPDKAPTFGADREKQRQKEMEKVSPSASKQTLGTTSNATASPKGILDTLDETVSDASLAGLDRFSFGGITALRDKFAQMTGKQQPSGAEMLEQAERRSPIATTVGATGADLAHLALTRGALGGLKVAPAVAKFAGGILPQGADAFVRSQLSGEPENTAQQAALGTARGVGNAVLPQVLQRLPGIAGTIAGAFPRVTDAASAVVPGLLTEMLRTGSSERERDAVRERERRRSR